jgi:hypothetical protein
MIFFLISLFLSTKNLINLVHYPHVVGGGNFGREKDQV